MLIESVEARRLFSVSASLTGSGVLVVTGTQGADDIRVEQVPPFIAADTVVVTDQTDLENPVVQVFSGVKAVLINTRGGDDKLLLSVDDINAAADLGSGNDSAEIFSNISACVVASGSEGNDTVTLNALSEGSIFYSGGNGDDHVDAIGEGDSDNARATLVLSGDNGNDFLSVSGHDINYVVLGGNGKDTIVVAATTSSGTVSGGNGVDTFELIPGATEPVIIGRFEVRI